MKIFIAHSTAYDYQNELYKPLRASRLNTEFDLFLPLENGIQRITKDHIKQSNVLVAEVSYRSTGQGIELGWADIFQVPIIYIHKKGMLSSRSLDKLSTTFLQYETADQMIEGLYKEFLKRR